MARGLLLVGLLLLGAVDVFGKSQSCTGAETCPGSELCSPQDACLNSSQIVMCGKYGAYLTCGEEEQLGVVTQECGSGKNADCSNTESCGSDTWEGILCDYPDLTPQGTPTSNWECGTYGTRLTCQDYVPDGGALVGVCGAGSNADCQGVCQPSGDHAVLCARNANEMNWRACRWYSKRYGEWAKCPHGYIGAGHCGSGKNDDCGMDIWHELMCCPFIYPFFEEGYGLDVELRQDVGEAVGQFLGPLITNAVNYAAANFPDLKGGDWELSDVELKEFELGDGELFNSPEGFSYRLSVTKFELSFRVKVTVLGGCKWYVTFTMHEEMPLVVPFQFNLTGDKVVFATDPFWYIQTSKAIDFDLKCETDLCDLNVVCDVSKSDLEALYPDFVQLWNTIPTRVGIGLNDKLGPLLDNLPLVLEVDVFGEAIGVDFRGLTTAIQTATSDQFESPVFQNLGGFFLEKNGETQYSPFPTTTPVTLLKTPPEQFTVYLTDYFFHSFVWGIEASGALDQTIPPGAIPSGSPFQLNTGNLIMRSIAPGLRKYGDSPMALVISTTNYAGYSELVVNSEGISTKNNTVIASFFVFNETTHTTGDFLFTLQQEYSGNLDLATNQSGSQLVLEILVSHLKCDSTKAGDSNVGFVNAVLAESYTETAIVLVQQTLFSQPFLIPLPIPGGVFGGGGKLVFTDDDYMFIGGDFFGI